MHRALVSVALALVAAFSVAPRTAHAAAFQIAPLAVTLSEKVPSGILKITNRGTESLRLHVSASAWQETTEGEMALQPTNDIVFFPAMITVGPGESRQLRVGSNTKPAAVEKTYRILVEELPPLVSSPEDATAAVRVLTKMSVPVFLQGPAPKAVPAVTAPQIKGNRLSFSVKNTGSAHFRSEKVVLRAKNGAQVVHTQELQAWYVLAGGTRNYVVNLPDVACKSLNSIEIDLQTDSGAAKTSLANAVCQPPASP